MKTKHTYGKWKADGNLVYIEYKDFQCAEICKTSVSNNMDCIISKSDAEANAKLIAEAGTVTNECGLTPRQLMEHRDELLKIAQHLVDRDMSSGELRELAENAIKKAING